MKKRNGILAGLLCAALLTSCGAPAGRTLGKAEEGSFTELADGNMQKNVPSGNFVLWEGKILFTYTDNRKGRTDLLCYDLETGALNPFCRDATCDHLGDRCASGQADCNLEAVGGEIFAGSWSHSGRVLQLRVDRFEPVVDSGVSHFFHADGDLYVATTDASLLVYEDGAKKPRTVLDEYAGYWENVSGGYLYYAFEGMNRIRLSEEHPTPEKIVENAVCVSDGMHIYYVKDRDGFLYRCGMDGSGEELLLDRAVLPASWNFDGTYLYFRLFADGGLEGEGDGALYRMRKSGGEAEKIAELPVPAYQIFMLPGREEMIVTTLTPENTVYLVSKDGKTVEPLTEPRNAVDEGGKDDGTDR